MDFLSTFHELLIWNSSTASLSISLAHYVIRPADKTF